MSSELELSDEQVQALHLDPTVVSARKAFLEKLVKGKVTEESRPYEQEYNRVFQETLKRVIENPPPKKSKKSLPQPLKGFGTREG